MKKITHPEIEKRAVYHADITQIYQDDGKYYLHLDNIRQFQPYQQITDVLRIKTNKSKQQQLADLDLKIGDRIEFVARYSYVLYGSPRTQEWRSQLNAPNKFKIISRGNRHASVTQEIQSV